MVTWSLTEKSKLSSGKKTAVSTNGTGSTCNQHVEECKFIHSYLLYKAQVQVDQRPHIKPDTLKLMEEKMRKSLKHKRTGANFLNRTPTMHVLISKIEKWDLIKLKSFCKSKDTFNRTKWQPTYLENSLPILYLIEG